jgi:hypothetical protein
MKKQQRKIDVFNLSFLDVVSCGFGAIILLLVISMVLEPLVIEKMSVDLSGLIMRLEQELFEIRGETRIMNRKLTEKQTQLSDLQEKIARLSGDLSKIRGQFRTARTEFDAQTLIEKGLQSAKQDLTEEMRRLQSTYQPPETDAVIGGVPVDSEYIIFIIDTSGSMQRFAWPLVRQMGDYMFSQYSGRWIPDSPARRRSILKRLATWKPFSNSSPVEGITSAVRKFYAPDKKISLYVLGDDFSRGSIQEVVDTVDRINKSLRGGERRVRIHAVGFPVLFSQTSAQMNVARFAALMRRLAEDNNGSFVGLNSLR